MIKLALNSILIVTVIACSPSKKAADSSVDEATKADTVLFASIQRTACYGRCPSYVAKIYDNGYAVYEGKMFVDKKGEYSAQVSEDEMKYLSDKAKEIGYFEMADKYDGNITDVPACITSMNTDGKKKTIYNRDGGPEELKQFQKIFDDMLNKLQWTKIADPKVIYEEDNE